MVDRMTIDIYEGEHSRPFSYWTKADIVAEIEQLLADPLYYDGMRADEAWVFGLVFTCEGLVRNFMMLDSDNDHCLCLNDQAVCDYIDGGWL